MCDPPPPAKHWYRALLRGQPLSDLIVVPSTHPQMSKRLVQLNTNQASMFLCTIKMLNAALKFVILRAIF